MYSLVVSAVAFAALVVRSVSFAAPLVFSEDHFDFSSGGDQFFVRLSDLDEDNNSFRVTAYGAFETIGEPGGYVSGIDAIYLVFGQYDDPRFPRFTDGQGLDATPSLLLSFSSDRELASLGARDFPSDPGVFNWSAAWEVSVDSLVGPDENTPGQYDMYAGASVYIRFPDGGGNGESIQLGHAAFSVSHIPEPHAAALFMTGALVVSGALRKRVPFN